MLNTLKRWDRDLFLLINRHHNSFFDVVMYWASDKLFWIPFYAFLLLIVIREFKKKSILIILHIAALIAASDQIAGLIKNTVKRLRPSHQPTLEGFIHLSTAGKGGLYGFISSHASNTFALFAFLSILLPRSYRPLKWVLFFWASLVAYSRVYNGVHYPADVLMAALLGSLLAWLCSRLYYNLEKKWK